MVTQEDNDFLWLQPEESLTGKFGNGWKGVWKWCEYNGPNLFDYMKKATPHIDYLVVHMDGDVSRKEKEVHCNCIVTLCDHVGTVHPLHCPICKSGKCPVMLPCEDHKVSGFAVHLRELIVSWLCITLESSPIIITIPCDSIDTWVAVSYGDLTDNCESHPDPWSSIIARSKYYHSIRIQGSKKRVPVYRELADNLCKNWETVKIFCPQAQLLESVIYDRMASEKG